MDGRRPARAARTERGVRRVVDRRQVRQACSMWEHQFCEVTCTTVRTDDRVYIDVERGDVGAEFIESLRAGKIICPACGAVCAPGVTEPFDTDASLMVRSWDGTRWELNQYRNGPSQR